MQQATLNKRISSKESSSKYFKRCMYLFGVYTRVTLFGKNKFLTNKLEVVECDVI